MFMIKFLIVLLTTVEILFSVGFLQDGLFFDKSLNFISLREIIQTNEQVVVYVFSFEEPMWKEDIKTLKRYLMDKIPLVCINTDKLGYKSNFASDEVFRRNKLILLFDPDKVNIGPDFSDETKIYVVYNNLMYIPVESYKSLSQYINNNQLLNTKNNRILSQINLLLVCGLKGKVTSCPSCPNAQKGPSWEQREALITAYKNKFITYAFELGNFLPVYPTENEIRSSFYASLLTGYDGFLFNINELLNLDRLLYYIIKENIAHKFLFSQKWQFVEQKVIETYKQTIFTEFKQISCNNNTQFLVLGLPPTTGHRNRVIVNTTDVNRIKQIVSQHVSSGVILLSNLTYLDDIELAKNIPEIKLVINTNHNYKLPQMIKNYNVPIIFPVCSSDYITRVCLYIEKNKIEDIKVSLIPIPQEIKINPELRKQLEKILSSFEQQ